MIEAEQVRQATVTWTGNLASGSGRVSATTSGAFSELPVTWASRTESPDGRTSPEELIAAAHAACFSMAFSSALTKDGTPPGQLEVTATVTFAKDETRWSIASSHLEVRGRVEGSTQAAFADAAERAKDGCPVSRALKGNVEVSVSASLER
ncbi:MAG TPA: OsmC family peroxiredoxin [Candidatus Limnocylindrales bacterium]|nr:OsmC family peroxiredoxin [Candidatus Limnocylindrales bacterium]